MTTHETDAQMHPGVTDFQALLAAISAWGDLLYFVEMMTLFGHSSSFPCDQALDRENAIAV